jgi:hypothetical protein
MEILKWLGMIIGIFCLLYISIKMLMRSEEKLTASKRSYRQNKQQTEVLHQQLDDMLVTLKSQNEMLEKVSDFFIKMNTRLFKK